MSRKRVLAGELGVTVIDRTNLSGAYGLKPEWSPDEDVSGRSGTSVGSRSWQTHHLPIRNRVLMPMTAFKRRPPAFAVRVLYCFMLDFVIAPVVRRLERSDRILKVLGAAT